MIKSYSDHAANERTFLAWVRTAVAIIAFGFVVEKFSLLGVFIVAVAGVRFIQTARAIDDEAVHRGPGSRIDVALAGLLFLLGCALLAYLAPSVIAAL
jgi:putative membrane protein